MVCQCGGTGKGIKSKVGRELDISLQALFTYLCDLCAFDCAISALILFFSTVMSGFNPPTPYMDIKLSYFAQLYANKMSNL
jgi:hypothetical protein